MISKELLSEVLEVEIESFSVVGSRLNYIVSNYETEEDGEIKYIDLGQNINIYELAHKCKEWALNKGYYLRAEQGINYKDNLQWTAFLNTDMDDGADYVDYWNNTETEAIFKACQWILENNSAKD